MQTGSFAPKVVLAAAVLLAGCGLCPARAAEAPSLERGLVGQAPGLIKHFKANGYENVGVLKFLIAREGAKSFSDNVGTLNLMIARRLEVALVLANEPKKPVGIIRNASAVAARTRGANHRTPPGRKKLFGADYPLAWGEAQVKADAFVTGTAEISKDLRKLTVSLFIFDKGKNKLEQVGEDFAVRIDARKLTEMNESFALRGLFDEGEAVETAALIKGKKAPHPLARDTSPVRLTVLYDGVPVKVEYRDGRAFIPEPRKGQEVAFRLGRDKSKARYGAVLKVNGENTVGRERQPDQHCRLWVLDAGKGPYLIQGYQIDAKTRKNFRVLSGSESKAREMNYGADVGTISLTVFRERQKEEVHDPLEARAKRDARVADRASLPANKATYKELRAELLREANEETRGLIGEGEKVASKVRVVPFHPGPTPVMSVTIVYYRP